MRASINRTIKPEYLEFASDGNVMAELNFPAELTGSFLSLHSHGLSCLQQGAGPGAGGPSLGLPVNLDAVLAWSEPAEY